jgi:8-oxo-dGTP pyrophosphatase MutT (NUDIX family)
MSTRYYLLRLARRVYDVVQSVLRPVTPSVRIILIKEGKTLLVHHTYAPKWYFPGGGIKRGESLQAGAIREAWEEVGAVVRDEPSLLGIYYYSVAGRSDHMAIYVSEDFDLAPPPNSWEIAARAWFDLDQLPGDMDPGCRRRLAEYRTGDGPYSKDWKS